MERQWHRLEVLTRSGVVIDCIALGNSMVLNGFDPRIFDQSFYEESGQQVTCFNFGVDGMPPVASSALAQILIAVYHPRLLVFGTDARDFAVKQDSWETTVFTEMPWVQYRVGQFNLQGWLVERSYLHRYRYVIADLLQLSIKREQQPAASRYGFEPQEQTYPIRLPPDPDDPAYQIQYYFNILDDYAVLAENEAALRQILARQNETTTVVVLEMPVADTFFHFYDDPLADYNEFLDTLRTTTAEHNVHLFETTRLHLIPDDGWMDYSHLNDKGAAIFSEWLGREIGRLVKNNRIRITRDTE
jgi:hypothetical protein